MKTNKEIIKEFVRKMMTQDNRATASPFFYVIRTKKKFYLPDGYGSEQVFKCDDCEYPSELTAARELFKYGYDKGSVKKLLKNGRWIDVAYDWIEKGMFLTETDAENHLKLNHYHYSKDAHTYVDHAWRAPELEEFFKALFSEYGDASGKND